MINWLKRLFHHHNWEDIDTKKVAIYPDFRLPGDDVPKYYEIRTLQRCSVCKKYRRQKIIY